jgi:FtsH-binding integral membrane protein
MSLYDREYMQTQSSPADVASFSSKVYTWMTMGLGITSAVAYAVAKTGLYVQIMPFWFLLILGTFFITFFIVRKADTMTFPTMATWLTVYAVIEGVFFGTILPAYALQYGGDVIWMAFLTSAVLYGIAAAYGTATKSDLTQIGRIFTLGVIGLMAVTFIFFIASFFTDVTWMTLVISYIGLGLFVGLTAYDAQNIRRLSAHASVGSATSNKLALMMALRMYTNVIMIFWFLLQIFSGGRRD